MSNQNSGKNIATPVKWVELYGDYLFNYAISRVSNQQVALDLVQDTFLGALSALESFEGRSTEKTWLISILKRKIIDHYRKSSRSKEDQLIDKNFAVDKDDLPFYSEGDMKGYWRADRVPQDWNISSEKALENEELKAIIEQCISGLSEKYAAVFTLRVIEEITSEEVCKELEITASNLWVILHRAKLQLRDCIENNWLK
jgi:RNA polymerase sigma-70 factor (TIGR02943 family)